MLNNIIGREIKITNINDIRLDEESCPMLYVDMLIYNNINHIFEIYDYNELTKQIAIYIGTKKVWLYRNEYIYLIRNLF